MDTSVIDPSTNKAKRVPVIAITPTSIGRLAAMTLRNTKTRTIRVSGTAISSARPSDDSTAEAIS